MEKTNAIVKKFEEALRKNSSLSLKYGGAKIDLYAGGAVGKPLYTVCWREKGKRCRYGTTRTESALEKIRSLVGAAELGAGKKISHQRVQKFVEVEPELDGIDLQELVRFYKEHVQVKSATLDEVCELYLSASKEKSQRYQETLRHYTQKLRAAFPQTRISSITAHMLDEYLTKNFPNPKTRNNHRGGICSLFAFAQRKSFLPSGQTEAKKTERPSTKVVEPSVVSSDDMTKLLGECSDMKLVAYLTISAFSGCRAAEITRMKWAHIKEDCIVLPPEITKTNRRRISEIPPNLALWLAPLRGKPEEPVTYPSCPLYRRLRTLFKRCGVLREPNALRHSYVSYHLEKHCDPPRTSKSAGHSLTVLEQNYLKLVSKQEAEAWFNITPPEGKIYSPVRTHKIGALRPGVTKRR